MWSKNRKEYDVTVDHRSPTPAPTSPESSNAVLTLGILEKKIRVEIGLVLVRDKE